MGYYDDYTGGIQIYQLDQKNKRRYGVELVECFPNNISAQQLTHEQATGVQKIQVTFTYRYWKNLTDEETYQNHCVIELRKWLLIVQRERERGCNTKSIV